MSQERDRYQRLQRHFQACLDLSGQDRDRYVSDLATTDPDLHEELRELLRLHDGEEAPPAAPKAPEPPRKQAGGARAGGRRWWTSTPSLVFLFGGLAVGSVLLVRAWVLERLEGDLKRQSASTLRAAVDLRMSNYRTWVAAEKQHAQKVLQDPLLVAQVSSLLEAVRTGEDRETQKKRLLAHPAVPTIAERMLRAPSEITDHGYMILTPSGLCVATDAEALVGDTLAAAGAGYLGRVVMGEILVSRPYPDRLYSHVMQPEFQNPVMYIAGAIRDASGRVIAVGSFKFSPKRLYEILSAANAEFVAFDSKSMVLSPLRGGEELKSWGLSPGPEATFQAYLRDPGMDLSSGKRPETAPASWPPTVMARSAVQGQDGTDAAGHRDLRGRTVVAAWTWLPEFEMGIGAQVPVDQVLAPAGPVRTALASLAAAFAFLTVAVFAGTLFLGIRARTRKDSPFGAYVIERRIGKGGMAEVFLARHVSLKRPAALKILTQPDPDRAAVNRFEREARLASGLSHPNTIQVFDFGEAPDGRLYYAMEYVEGLTLAQFLALEGPPPVARAVHLLRQIAGSLGEAHRAGLLHRDLKPSNIMITSSGGQGDVVKVLDFGIATSVNPASDDFTRSTALLGTPAFLAPERIRTPLSMDPRSDVYSFGAVAFYLLTGRNVFEGTTPTELLYQVMTAARPSPSRLRAEKLPETLETLILSCLAIEPDDRPASIQSVDKVLGGISTAEAWTPEDATRWWEQNRERVITFSRAAQ